jgi:protein MpaA
MVKNPQWAVSAHGKPIVCYQSDTNLKGKHPLFLIGGVHGDEPEGVRLADELLEWLKKTDPKSIRRPWVLIPNLNPDGFYKLDRTNGNGVDLNRNYPSKGWRPDAKAPRYYPGPLPGSEPEIKSLVNLIQELQPELIIHFHSWRPCIVYAGDPAVADAKALAESSGYELLPEIGYDTPGALSEYGWKDNQIPVICIEEQDHIALDKVWGHFAQGFEKIFTVNSKIR